MGLEQERRRRHLLCIARSSLLILFNAFDMDLDVEGSRWSACMYVCNKKISRSRYKGCLHIASWEWLMRQGCDIAIRNLYQKIVCSIGKASHPSGGRAVKDKGWWCHSLDHYRLLHKLPAFLCSFPSWPTITNKQQPPLIGMALWMNVTCLTYTLIKSLCTGSFGGGRGCLLPPSMVTQYLSLGMK